MSDRRSHDGLGPIQPDPGVTKTNADYLGPGDVPRRYREKLTAEEWGDPRTYDAYLGWAATEGRKP